MDIIDSTWCVCFSVSVSLIVCFGFQRKKCINLRFCSAGPLHTESLRLNTSPLSSLKLSPSTSNMLYWNTLGNFFLTKCWLTELLFVSIVIINSWVWRKGNSGLQSDFSWQKMQFSLLTCIQLLLWWSHFHSWWVVLIKWSCIVFYFYNFHFTFLAFWFLLTKK